LCDVLVYCSSEGLKITESQRRFREGLAAQAVGRVLELTAPIPNNPGVTLPAVIETLTEQFATLSR
jgi:hypothetical protein